MLIAVLAGDGIGPEVTHEAVKALCAADARYQLGLRFENALVGGAAYDAEGHPLPDATMSLCRRSDAILLGAVGGPKWDKVEPPSLRPEAGALLKLRGELGLFANLRPVRQFTPLIEASPLKANLVEGLDILIVRELTGGIYFGVPKERRGTAALDTCVYTEQEIERIARLGHRTAQSRRKCVTSVDKANVLETSRLWRETVTRVAADFPDVHLNHMLVDNAAMQLVHSPKQFDVLLTENMFGDILSDEAAALTGSLGLMSSASLSEDGPGLYEPAHGSAPDIAGQGKANPLAAILSAALLLRYAARHEPAAQAIETAVDEVVASGVLTADLGGTASTSEVGNAVEAAVR